MAASVLTKWMITPAFVKPDLPERNVNTPLTTAQLNLARMEDLALVSLKTFLSFMDLEQSKPVFVSSDIFANARAHTHAH
jgi:hypothetical protein